MLRQTSLLSLKTARCSRSSQTRRESLRRNGYQRVISAAHPRRGPFLPRGPEPTSIWRYRSKAGTPIHRRRSFDCVVAESAPPITLTPSAGSPAQCHAVARSCGDLAEENRQWVRVAHFFGARTEGVPDQETPRIEGAS